MNQGTSGSLLNLINIPEKRTVWVNVFERFVGAKLCSNKAEAEHDATIYGTPRIACVKVEFTEGEGL